MPRQYVKIWKETTYGVFANPTTPVKNTDYIVTFLDQNNSFSMRPTPKQQAIRSASGGNRRVILVGDKTSVTGSLQTLVFPEQFAFLMDAATTLTSGDLSSYTIDHAIVDMSGSTRYRRYLGVKVGQANLSASADNTPFRWKLDLIAQKPASPNITITDFPEPATTEYPTGIPFVFTHMASPGYLNIGSARSEFAGFDLSFKNMVDAPFFEGQYVSAANFCGRDIDWTNKLKFKSATDRTNYEANTATTCSASIDNGVHKAVLSFNGANFLTAVEDDLALDKCYYQNLSWSNYEDNSAGADFSYAYGVS